MNSQNYFKIERTILRITGLSLSENESVAYRIYSFFAISLFTVTYCIFDIRELFKHDFYVIANKLPYTFGVTLSTFKALVVLRNKTKLRTVLEKLEMDPFVADVERGGLDEKKLIKECTRITRFQNILYYTLTLYVIAITSTATLIKRIKTNDPSKWEFPFGPFTVLNVTYSPNYEITWTYQTLTFTIVALKFLSIDLILAGILAHLSYHFKILQINIIGIVEHARKQQQNIEGELNDQDSVDVSKVSWKYLQDSLKNIVRYHLSITDIVQKIEEIFSILLLFLFFSILGMLCFVIYQMSTHRLEDLRSVIGIINGTIVSLQIFLICYWGEQMTQESQNVGRAVYECNFVGTDLRFQKALVIIMRRSLNPVTITAGKFVNISLATFAWIIRTSYSAFNVIQGVNNN